MQQWTPVIITVTGKLSIQSSVSGIIDLMCGAGGTGEGLLHLFSEDGAYKRRPISTHVYLLTPISAQFNNSHLNCCCNIRALNQTIRSISRERSFVVCLFLLSNLYRSSIPKCKCYIFMFYVHITSLISDYRSPSTRQCGGRMYVLKERWAVLRATADLSAVWDAQRQYTLTLESRSIGSLLC